MKRWIVRATVCSILSVVVSAAVADDIELFAAPSVGEAGAPNVLFVLDNASNFSSNVTSLRCSISASGVVETDPSSPQFTSPTFLDGTAAAVEQCALYSALQAIDPGEGQTFNIGVMGFNATGMPSFDPVTNTTSDTPCAGNTGGCLLMRMVAFDDQNKPNILNWIRQWSKAANQGIKIDANNAANGAAMQESWAYYFGKTGVSGRNYAGIQPQSSVCGTGNYVIFVGNAYRNNSTAGDQTNEANSPRRPFLGLSTDVNMRADPETTLLERALYSGSITTQCGTASLPASNQYEGSGAYALNWATYMRRQGIITYSVGVLGPTCNASYAAHLTKLGQPDVGGGKFFGSNDYDELRVAIGTIFSEILSANSAFASVSLPVSVNTQGTYLNQVYIGMFRPDKDFLPRWPGNLKQYRMALLDGDLRMVDANTPAQSAISGAGTGFIAECARSYWTPSAVDSYWGATFETANCSPISASSNTPDGNIVEKGGQAYTLRATSPSARTVLTCNTDCSDLDDFLPTNSAITKAALGDASMSDADRSSLINWVRGANNKGDELLVPSTAMRPSVHGDIVHSRPVAINFATGSEADDEAGRETVVFYGGNDGVLRAINGNRDGGPSIGGVSPGAELWSFVAPESYPILDRIRDNLTPIYYRGTTADNAQPKAYGFDGPVTAYRDASNTWIFASMRRGGRMLYAFDVTDPVGPDIKWRVGCPQNFALDGTIDDTGCMTGLDGIGQTWSPPTVLSAAGHTGPLLMLGGGYDVCEDHDGGMTNHVCTVDSKGRYIYVLNAATGALLKTFNTERPVVGEITVVPDPFSGVAKYAYASDLGGNVYRITIGVAAPVDWTITKIAALGCDDGGTCAANRKFMFGPDVIDEFGTHILLIGSGDREKPLSNYSVTGTVDNYFFMLKDRPSDPDWLVDECDGNDYLCLESLLPIGSGDPSEEQLATKKGWFLGMLPTEQVVTSAVTVFGTATFSTHVPYVQPSTIETVADCQPNLGTARVYNIQYRNAASANNTLARFQLIAGGGLPPSPVAGRVTLDDGTTVPFIIGASPESPLQSTLTTFTGVSTSQPKVRVYRYIQK